MATVVEDFVYPLILLLVGAGISGVLVSWLTNRWQDRRRLRDIEIEDRMKQLENELEDRRQKQQNELEDLRKKREFEAENHRKEREIKVELVSKMSEVISQQLSYSILLCNLQRQVFTDAENNDVWEEYSRSFTSVNVIRSKLQSYYLGKDTAEKRDKYLKGLSEMMVASRNYFEKTTRSAKDLEFNLNSIKYYFSDDKLINSDKLTTTYNEDLCFDILFAARRHGDRIIKEVINSDITAF